MKKLLAISLAALVSACAAASTGDAIHDDAPPNERWRFVDTYEIDPPVEFFRSWRMMQLCMDIDGYVDFEDVRWMIKLDDYLYRRVIGRVTDSNGGVFDLRPSAQMKADQAGEGPITPTIWLAAPFATNFQLIEHEIAHVLVGAGGHPDPPFGSCAVDYDLKRELEPPQI